MARSSHRLSPPQRAAALLVALGPAAASGLLSYLDESEVEAITAEIAGLAQMSDSIVDEIVEDLRKAGSDRRSTIEGGMGFARKLLEGWGPRGDAILERVAGAGPSGRDRARHFGFLAAVSAPQIARLLTDEHPQAAAVVLAQLDPAQAGAVLGELEADRRGDVAGRIARLETVSPDTIRTIEESLAPRVTLEIAPSQAEEHDGAKDLAAILNSIDRDTESAILSSLEGSDAILAGRVRSLLFIFDDLLDLRDRDLQEALRAVDAPTLALALKGADPAVREAIMRNLSERARTAIAEEMEVLGMVKRSDVEAARTKVVAAVRSLEEEGKIVLRQAAEGGMVE